MSQISGHRYDLPPLLHNADGTLRRVGFELEFSGVEVDEAIQVIKSVFNAEEVSKSSVSSSLQVAQLGKFGIEIDWEFLKQVAEKNADDPFASDVIEQVGNLATFLVPVEVVCPPIALDRLSVLDGMVDALREAGAIGTEESLLSAFGVHINTEVPALEAQSVHHYLRAFCVLQWWLVEQYKVDISRKISSYVDPYPEAYVLQVAAQSQADWPQIIDDYLQYNPSRNRALDMLPILGLIDENRVRDVVRDKRIKTRPTFHYRLPDCHIERPDWSLADAWNSWLVVERLAVRPEDLDYLSEKLIGSSRPILGVNKKDWVQWIDQWLRDHALV